MKDEYWVRFNQAFSVTSEKLKELSQMTLDIPEPTWKDRISEIPYLIAYYVSYPLIWLICELWYGLHDSWVDIWND